MTDLNDVKSLCRCCHALGNFKSLSLSYLTNGVQEVFSEMLRETFDVNIEPFLQDNEVNTHCICPPCAARLRDAFIFKKQVLASEKKFLRGVKGIQSSNNLKIDVKIESDSFPAIREEYLSIYSESEEEEEVQLIDDDPKQLKPQQKKEKPKYSCNVCQRLYVNNTSLEMHMKKHSGEASYPCFLCEAKFFLNRDLSQHIDDSHRIDGKYACTTCDKRYDKAKILKSHVQSHMGDKFICDYCNKEYTRKKNLICHMKLHTGDDFKCEVCSKAFCSRHQLKLHMAIHVEGKPYVCELCGKQFHQVSSIKPHYRRMHLGIRPKYPCRICNKMLATRYSVTKHEETHVTEKLFACEVCGKAFKGPDHVKRHMIVHTGEKKFECKYCGKRFAHYNTCVLHERRHTGEKPYVCKVCLKAFHECTALKIHMRLHTGERPYPCDFCDKRFNENNQRKRHMRRHTGEKESCKICGRLVKDIYKHIKAVHSDKPTSQLIVVDDHAAADLSEDMADYDAKEFEFEPSDGGF